MKDEVPMLNDSEKIDQDQFFNQLFKALRGRVEENEAIDENEKENPQNDNSQN